MADGSGAMGNAAWRPSLLTAWWERMATAGMGGEVGREGEGG